MSILDDITNAFLTIMGANKPIQGSASSQPWYDKINGQYRIHNTDGTVVQIDPTQIPQGANFFDYDAKNVQEQVVEPVQTINDYAYYTRGQVPQDLQPLISKVARQYGLDPSILAAMLFQESGINPNTRDNPNIDPVTGAVVSRDRGIAQINNLAHPEISDEQARDINFAIPFMAKELSSVYKERNSWPQAIAAYNVGRGRVGYDDSRDEYGLGEKGREYVSGIRRNLDPKYAERIGLPDYDSL